MARSIEERITATLRRLEAEANVWIATSSRDGVPHLVPLSLAWDGTSILVATPSVNPTARNVAATGSARAALDDADDVVMITADAREMPYTSVDTRTAASLVERLGWDPAREPGTWSLLVLEPRTVHAWRGVSEIDDRTIMRSGAWLTSP